MKRGALFFLILSLSLSLGAGSLYYWGHRAFHMPGPAKQPVHLFVPRGTSLNQTAKLLRKVNAIDNPNIFVWGTLISRKDRSIKAGEYKFQPGSSQHAILTALTLGKTVRHRITVPEGLSVSEISKILNNTIALSGSVLLPPEGSILPETYSFERGETRAGLIRRMTASMRDTVTQLWANRADGLALENSEQAVILASIVEKETSITEERSRVAAVFLNRLRKGMRLQSDPTVVYGITRGQRQLGRALTRKDLNSDTPFNTYRITGLPPSPICNPGQEAIAAVLNPLNSEELYFVADGTGGHVFAKTLAEHNRNVTKWRQLQLTKKP